METNKKTLFSNFSPVTKEAWTERVHVDLKGADFNRKLVWKNLNKLEFQPFYNTEDTLEYLTNTGENSQDLINYRAICVASAEDGNKRALKAIKEGVTGLLFHMKGPVSTAVLLKEVDINKIAVSFVLDNNVIIFAKDFFAFAEQNLDNSNLRGYFDLEIISDYITKGSLDTNKFETLEALLKLGESYSEFKTISVSGTTFLDAGSNQVQEVAYTLNALVYLIEQCLDRGINIESIFNNLHVQLAIGSEYFIEIAKFRAFNSLLNAIANQYGVTCFNS